MPKVLNKHRDKNNIPPGAEYVGRPTKWGNPWVIGADGSREQVIQMYRDELINSPVLQYLRDSLTELKGKDLVCWCSPLPCHADVLLELADATD